jgi:hypothetical protein
MILEVKRDPTRSWTFIHHLISISSASGFDIESRKMKPGMVMMPVLAPENGKF